ncbi:MAG: hypothetical protein KBT27_06940, partial [Prevotellaceae bacterium]|nr:hypothetical protein [Candidatus Faecinaster equi]
TRPPAVSPIIQPPPSAPAAKIPKHVNHLKTETSPAGGDKSDLFRIAWDNGKYGQAFKGSGTFKGNVKLYYNILLTGTVGQVRKYYKDVENGMVTRVSYSEIENQTFAAFEAWKQLSTKQKNVIKAFVDRTDEKTYKNPCDFDMDELRNMDEEAFKADAPWQMEYRNFENIDMSWFFPTIQNWLEVQRKKSIEAVDFARDTFRRRAALKGFRMAMICTQCWMIFSKREQKITSDFVTKWMDYDLESSLRLFGDLFNNNIQETQVKKVAFNSLFDAMPDEFNTGELSAKARQMFIKSNTRQIIYAWCKIKLIEPCLDENDKKIYRKVKPKNKKK